MECSALIEKIVQMPLMDIEKSLSTRQHYQIRFKVYI